MHINNLRLPVYSVSALLIAASANAGLVVDPGGSDNASLINFLVGADSFYNNGYWGGNAVIANVEAGHVWNGHDTLQNVSTFVNDPSLDTGTRQYDYHATMVGFLLNGLGPQTANGYYYWQMGIAPGSKLFSSAIATTFSADGSFNTTDKTETYAYQKVMQSGVTYDQRLDLGGGSYVTYQVTRKADVVNSSWGFPDPSGTGSTTRMVDALAYQNHQTVVMAAGNDAGPVSGPASGYNTIAVGALQGNWTIATAPVYNQLADFSNVGPNSFYNPSTDTLTQGVRAKVDIVAPGTDYYLPAYLGATGSNPIDPAIVQQFGAGATNIYASGAAGTSFASPVVAGGAALLVDAGYANAATFGAYAVDGRVIKAILLNSADKPTGWNNGESLINGVVRTTQSLDYALGAGALNLTKAYTQFTGGTTDVAGSVGGAVAACGWDFGHVIGGTPNDYYLSGVQAQGTPLIATLDWFVNRSYTYDPITGIGTGSDVQFSDLSLQVWQLDTLGQPATLVGESNSAYNNVEHLYFNLPQDGRYMLRVSWLGDAFGPSGSTVAAEDYALAWTTSVPEPMHVLSLLTLGAVLMKRRRTTAR